MPATRRDFGAAGVILAALVLAGCNAEDQPQAEDRPARPVLVQRVAYESSVPARTFVGTIRPRVESDLGFRVAGKVAKRLVDIGDIVSAGTPLATLDEVDFQLQMDQAQAELKAAQTGVKQADADLTRTMALAGRGWTAAATVDRQRSATEEARSRLLRADRALSLAKNSFTYAVLTADADGVVTATSVEAGQVVAAGQTAIRVAHTAEREAVIAIPEALVGRARGGTARITLWSNDKASYAAKLRELSPAADTATRTFLARFSILGADDFVRLGMTASVTLTDPASEKTARVPISAIFDQGHGPAVWAVDGADRLTLKPVTIARFEASEALVSQGVADGDRIVRLGVQKIDPNLKVRVVDALKF